MTVSDSDRELLRRVRLFADLSEEDLSWVADGGDPMELAAGDPVGDRGGVTEHAAHRRCRDGDHHRDGRPDAGDRDLR